LPDVTILLADDHSIVRRGLRAMIESQPGMTVVGEAITGREVVQLCEQLQPRIAIVDIAMPQLNGIDATEQLKKRCPDTTVVILSMHADEAYILRALTVGAKAYILKDTAETDLLPAIDAVVRGRPYFSPRVADMLLDDHVRFLRQRGLQDSYDLLTDREKEVLQLIAEGRSNKEVANLLNLGVSTVETHRGNVMQKLDLHSTAEIVLYAMRKRLIS
jgi:two-component system, NarL family, response regulator NreC